MRRMLLLAALAWGLAPLLALAAPTEIRLWHAMSGAQGDELEGLVARFNASQRAWKVLAEYKGGYPDTLAAALAETRKEHAPHLVQADDTRTADLLARKPAVVRPLWQVMAQAGQSLPGNPVQAVAGSFSDAKRRLLALPLVAATPVLYYNREALQRAKLDPQTALKDWWQMAKTLDALTSSGQTCGLTSAWPSWVLLETMSAWHNQPFATRQNGMAGGDARLAFNGHLMVRWVSMLASWKKSGYFDWSGRENEAEARFAAGECALLTSSSASYEGLVKRATFELAVAPLPHYDDFGTPQNTLINGAALWVWAGRARKDYAGVASFVGFLSSAEVQADWHQKTGYVPLVQAASDIARAKGFYAARPGHEVALRQLVGNGPGKEAHAIRLDGLPRIREIINEELEAVWSEAKTPLDALNAAVLRGNAILAEPKPK